MHVPFVRPLAPNSAVVVALFVLLAAATWKLATGDEVPIAKLPPLKYELPFGSTLITVAVFTVGMPLGAYTGEDVDVKSKPVVVVALKYWMRATGVDVEKYVR